LAADDTLTVSSGGKPTILVGGNNGDVIHGTSSGDDLIDGGGGNNTIYAGGGNDVIFGGTNSGNNVINLSRATEGKAVTTVGPRGGTKWWWLRIHQSSNWSPEERGAAKVIGLTYVGVQSGG
jgi:hypothetical protein